MFFVLFLGVFVLSLFAIITMIVSLAKQGGEKRKRIVEKASANTFVVTAGLILICAAEAAIHSLTQETPAAGMNPFIALTVIAAIYAGQLLYCRKKHTESQGDKDSEAL